MTIVDAFALIALLLREPASEEVRALLLDQGVSMAATSLAETFDRILRSGRVSHPELEIVIDRLLGQSYLTIVSLDDQLARRAGSLRAEYYRRKDRAVSHADCVAAATAELLGSDLCTSDPGLAAMARAIDVDVIAIPDSSGRRP